VLKSTSGTGATRLAMKKDKDLDALRNREDFKKLLVSPESIPQVRLGQSIRRDR
jgi:hypothetical protein